MTVKTFLATAQKLPVDTSVLLRGNHGIGKSQIVCQAAKLLGFKKEDVIDRRLSQMSDGDMIGLPSTDGECTRFNPPDWYRSACKSPKVLLLDELNRATPEVMQAAFQIVLDRELNGWKLHPGTRVFSAINSSAAYNVNEVDPALLDRFWVIDLEPSVDDWMVWARDPELGAIPEVVTDFIAGNEKFLDPPKNAEPGSVQTSRRSWERAARALKSAGVVDEPNDPLFYSLAIGYLGAEATIALTEFAKSIDTRVTGEEIINDYAKVAKKIDKLGQERLNTAIEKIADYVTNHLESLTDKQGKNLATFMKRLPGELRISCWSKLMSKGVEKLDLAKSVHKYCAELILDVFGVPMGEAGIGVVPNIPDALNPDKPAAAAPAAPAAKKSRKSKGTV